MSFLRKKTLTVVLILIVGWLGYKGYHIQAQRLDEAAGVAELEGRVADLQRDNTFLASSSAYFGSDAYLERQARLKLNDKMPDEKVAFVYKDTSVQTSPSATVTAHLQELPNWEKWWYYLLGYQARN